MKNLERNDIIVLVINDLQQNRIVVKIQRAGIVTIDN